MSRIASLLRLSGACVAACALVLGGTLASCSNLVGPGVDDQSAPFYYYEGEKIYLRVLPTLLTAQPEAANDTARIRTLLAERGVAPDSMRPLRTGAPGHWLVHLPAAASARTAEAAARALRLAEGIRFASAAYDLREKSCPMYMVNRLAVEFRAGADARTIARLNAGTGVRNETRYPWGTRMYEYPARMAATPLELAAHYYRHSAVEWAEADRVSTCVGPAVN